MSDAETPTRPESPREKAQRWRGFLSFVLIALSILCLVVGSLFVWMRATAFTPDGYVAQALTVEGETVINEKVTSFVKDELLPQSTAESLARKVVEPLPLDETQKAFLATGIASGARSQVGNAVSAFLDSGPGKEFGAAISTRLSEQIVKLVDDNSGVFEFQGDSIVLDTAPIVQGARAKAEDALGDLARFLPPPPESYRTITVVQGDYVLSIQKAINIIWLLAWLLPLLFLILLALGIFTARERRPAAFRAMIAIIVGVAAAAIGIRLAKRVITGLISEGPGQDVVDAILSAATSELVDQTLVIMLIASLAGLVLWMLGPDTPARYARGWIAARWGDLLTGQRRDAGRITDFARRYRPHVEIAGVVLTVIALLLVPSLTAGTWILALIALAVWLLLIEYACCAGWMQACAHWIAGLRKKPTAQ